MKLLFLFCLLAFIAPAPGDGNLRHDTRQTSTLQQSDGTYRTFQPSKIKKQKRKLRQRISALGWGLLLLGIVAITGVVLLLLHLWPAAGVFWRIVMVWLGLSLSVGFLLMGLLGIVFGWQSQRDVRTKATARLEKLARKLDFTPEKIWCFPDEYFRLSMAANKSALLIVDYQQDKGWIIPKENIADMRTDSVTIEQAEARYPSAADSESVILHRTLPEYLPPRAPAPPLGPMQVLDVRCRNQALQRITLVYHPSVFGDSTQTVLAGLQALWNVN